MCCDRKGFESPEIVIDSANHNQFMVGTNTLAAKDTLTEVPDNERICLLQAGIMGHGIKPYLAYTQSGGNLSQLASVSLVTYDAGLRVTGYHQADNICPVLLNGGSVCLDDHIRRYGRYT
jgi:hypothetical protein